MPVQSDKAHRRMHTINAKWIELVVFSDEKNSKLIFSYGETNTVQENNGYGWKDYKFCSSKQIILIRQIFLLSSSLSFFFLQLFCLELNAMLCLLYSNEKEQLCVYDSSVIEEKGK